MSKQDRHAIKLATRFKSFYAKKNRGGREEKTIYFHNSSIEKVKKKKMSNLGTYTLREIWVNINAALRAYLVQKYYSILRRQRLPPSNRFKKLLVEVVGQITPAEPYKSTALTIFEITLPLLGVITLLSVLPNTYVTLATRRYYLHLENVLHVQKYTDLRNEYIYAVL